MKKTSLCSLFTAIAMTAMVSPAMATITPVCKTVPGSSCTACLSLSYASAFPGSGLIGLSVTPLGGKQTITNFGWPDDYATCELAYEAAEAAAAEEAKSYNCPAPGMNDPCGGGGSGGGIIIQ